MCIIYFLFFILATAAVMDLLFGKVYNEWILGAVVIGLSYSAWTGGATGLLWALITMTIPVMILYPLFMIGGLGAGDIKLLAAAGCFLTVRETLTGIGISFLIGAVFSLFKMIAERNFLQRMQYLLSYIHDVFKAREWKFYEQDIEERKGINEGKIHFALPILLGIMICKGGIHW